VHRGGVYLSDRVKEGGHLLMDVGGTPTVVDSPWVTNPVLWRKYKPKDSSAYRLLDLNAPELVPKKPLNPYAPSFVPRGTA